MSTLLEETKNCIKRHGMLVQDITFIGSVDSGHCCSWKKFCGLADFEYDDSFGAQHVATDLVIIFNDNSYMKRNEYDGSEWWSYVTKLKIPMEVKRIECLGGDDIMWKTLEDINDD